MLKSSFLRRVLPYTIFFIVGVAAGLWLSQQVVTAPTTSVLGSNAVASLMIDYGSGTLSTYLDVPLLPGDTLLSFTKRVAEQHSIALVTKDYANLGAFISSINGLPKDTNVYWQYWVNNRYGLVGADQYVMKAADAAEWKLTSSKE